MELMVCVLRNFWNEDFNSANYIWLMGALLCFKIKIVLNVPWQGLNQGPLVCVCVCPQMTWIVQSILIIILWSLKQE